MLINLKTAAANHGQQVLTLVIEERLPSHLHSPCVINCQFTVSSFDNYYLVKLKSDSLLTLTCQRCLGEFSYPYSNQTELAVCAGEEVAEKMMGQYDCIVSEYQVDLQALLADELHLYAPEFHLDHRDCDHEVDRFIDLQTE
jgi:uncharacterized protein